MKQEQVHKVPEIELPPELKELIDKLEAWRALLEFRSTRALAGYDALLANIETDAENIIWDQKKPAKSELRGGQVPEDGKSKKKVKAPKRRPVTLKDAVALQGWWQEVDHFAQADSQHFYEMLMSQLKDAIKGKYPPEVISKALGSVMLAETVADVGDITDGAGVETEGQPKTEIPVDLGDKEVRFGDEQPMPYVTNTNKHSDEYLELRRGTIAYFAEHPGKKILLSKLWPLVTDVPMPAKPESALIGWLRTLPYKDQKIFKLGGSKGRNAEIEVAPQFELKLVGEPDDEPPAEEASKSPGTDAAEGIEGSRLLHTNVSVAPGDMPQEVQIMIQGGQKPDNVSTNG